MGTIWEVRDRSYRHSEWRTDINPHANEVLIIEPAEEKNAFMKHLTRHVPAVAGKIKGVETVDHPTEGQLLAYARKHFLS